MYGFSVPLNATSSLIYCLQVEMIRVFCDICEKGGKRKEITKTTKVWLLVA